MIDLHAHILPGVDDGAYDVREALSMARMAVESGVTAMVATPHCNVPEDRYALWSPAIREECEKFRKYLKAKNVPLKLYDGMEIFGTREAPRRLKEGKLHTLNDSQYPLVEFPFYDYGEEATEILNDFLRMGFRPVVAHPERYDYVQNAPRLLNLWLDMGCLMQINRGSLLGRFGARAEALAYSMVARGFVTCVASDAHTSTIRTPWMKDLYDLLSGEYSEHMAKLLFTEYPRMILENKTIEIEEPEWF